MRKLIILILFSIPIQSIAFDWLLVTMNNTTNRDSIPLDTVVAINGNYSSEDSIRIEEVVVDDYTSFDLVTFDMGEVPVDEDLFNYQVSRREFSVPMDYNRLVKAQIDYFGTTWQVSLKQMITKSKYFFPFYEEILNENDMPLEIKYLSIIESALNPHARSRSGAAGAWQFMPATGRIFNMNVSSTIDERRSLEKSTRAACGYLKKMYSQYNDWLVALAAYNCGPGNVRKAMRLSGHNDFWGMYNFLPRETQNYVPKFIAMTYMMTFYDQYGITGAPYEAAYYDYEQVYCQEGLDFDIIAERLGLTSEELLKYNPEMKQTAIPYKGFGYNLNVPIGSTSLFYENEKDIFSISFIKLEEKRIAEANKPKVVYHYVRKGECLPIIARKHGCTVSQLKEWNGIRGNLIHPKQKLKVNGS